MVWSFMNNELILTIGYPTVSGHYLGVTRSHEDRSRHRNLERDKNMHQTSFSSSSPSSSTLLSIIDHHALNAPIAVMVSKSGFLNIFGTVPEGIHALFASKNKIMLCSLEFIVPTQEGVLQK